MKTITFRCGALALACLLLAACKEKHDPLKPTVERLAVPVLATAS